MADKNKVDVRIAGKDYTLKGIESEEYIQKIALYIDKKINEITRVSNKLSTSMASVLTAVNVADDYFKSHENETRLNKELKQVMDELQMLRKENDILKNENEALKARNTDTQLDLVKKEAEIKELRNVMNNMPGRTSV